MTAPVIIIGLLLFIYALPWFFGRPLTAGKIQLVLTSKLNQDCEMQRAYSLLTRVYRDFRVLPSLSDARPVPSQAAPFEDARIFVGPPIATGAAESTLQHLSLIHI